MNIYLYLAIFDREGADSVGSITKRFGRMAKVRDAEYDVGDLIHSFPGSLSDNKIKWRFRRACNIKLEHGVPEDLPLDIQSCEGYADFSRQFRSRQSAPIDQSYEEVVITAWGVRFNEVRLSSKSVTGIDTDLTYRDGRDIPRTFPLWLQKERKFDYESFLECILEITKGLV